MYFSLGLLILFLKSSQGIYMTDYACEFHQDCWNKVFVTDSSFICVLGKCYVENIPFFLEGPYEPENITERECTTTSDCKKMKKCRDKECKCQEYRGSGLCEWECNRDRDCYTKKDNGGDTFSCANQRNGNCRCQKHRCTFEEDTKDDLKMGPTPGPTEVATPSGNEEDKVYYCSEEVADWTSAKKTCKNNGRTLAMPRTLADLNRARTACGFPEIENRNKNDWWHPFADPKKTSAARFRILRSHFFWIGGSAAGFGSGFKYVDGSDVPAKLYLPGQYQPVAQKTQFGAQLCLMGNSGLDNNICSFQVRYVCEDTDELEFAGFGFGRSASAGREE